MEIKICVGSSCYLKGSARIVELFTEKTEEYNLNDKITLSGSFCIGKCNRMGVTIQIDDEVHTGVTVENFNEFFNKNVLERIQERS